MKFRGLRINKISRALKGRSIKRSEKREARSKKQEARGEMQEPRSEKPESRCRKLEDATDAQMIYYR
jgi:hypothetical protein